MDIVNKSVLNNIKSGQYFIDARVWYSRKFVYPVIERSLMIIIATIFLLALLNWVNVILSLYPNKIVVPVTIYNSDSITYQPLIKNVSKGEIHPDPSHPIAKYLAANYVKTRESYNYKKLKEQVDKIRNNSTKFVYKQFYSSISMDNPQSPVLIFQDTNIRTIDIKSTNYSTDENNILVKFDATTINYKTKISETTSWVANVSFSMSDINNVITDNKKFYFIVTNYQAQQIK
jgi:type IV secretory pathway component VirB8